MSGIRFGGGFVGAAGLGGGGGPEGAEERCGLKTRTMITPMIISISKKMILRLVVLRWYPEALSRLVCAGI